MDDTDQSELVRVKKIIEAEVKAASQMTPQDRGTVSSFRDALVQPYDTEVNFSGGTMQRCLTVTRTDGTYRVVYMPVAGYFPCASRARLARSTLGCMAQRWGVLPVCDWGLTPSMIFRTKTVGHGEEK